MSYPNILALLEKKRGLCLQVEQMSEILQSEEVEALEQCITRRQETLNQVEELDIQLRALAAQDEAVRCALNQTVSREGLSADLGALYDASLAVKAVINRILQNESLVVQHFEDEKQRIQGKLEEIGKSGSAVAGQYYASMQTGTQRRSGGIAKKI